MMAYTDRQEQIRRLREAVKANDDQTISERWDESLSQEPALSDVIERIKLGVERARKCSAFKQALSRALAEGDEARIERLFDEDRVRECRKAGLDAGEIEKARELIRGRRGLAALRAALEQGDVEKIAAAQLALPKAFRERLTDAERKQAAAAFELQGQLENLEAAVRSDDDREIVSAWTDRVANYERLDPQLRERVSLARRRLTALERLHAALASEDDQAIIEAYVPELRDYTRLTDKELKRIAKAETRVAEGRELRAALAELRRTTRPRPELDRRAARASLELLASLALNAEQKAIWKKAYRRYGAYCEVKLALGAGDEAALTAAWDPLLDDYDGFTPAELESLAAWRRNRLQTTLTYWLEHALKNREDARLVRYANELRENSFVLTPDVQIEVERAQGRLGMLAAFHDACEQGDDRRVVELYARLGPEYREFRSHDHQRAQAAQERLKAAQEKAAEQEAAEKARAAAKQAGLTERVTQLFRKRRADDEDSA